MTKKCADLSKTELGTNCLTEIILLSQSRVVFLLSINKSLTCILISAQRALSLTGLSYMYIQTKTPPAKKEDKCKGSISPQTQWLFFVPRVIFTFPSI